MRFGITAVRTSELASADPTTGKARGPCLGWEAPRLKHKDGSRVWICQRPGLCAGKDIFHTSGMLPSSTLPFKMLPATFTWAFEGVKGNPDSLWKVLTDSNCRYQRGGPFLGILDIRNLASFWYGDQKSVLLIEIYFFSRLLPFPGLES
jgi:hypothetical protein